LGDKKPYLVVIVGPTAVGKTEISIQLAEFLDGEIVSADSRLFYRGMDIGTAKPSLAERLRVPHHLVDIADPCETWSLSLFQDAANKAILEILARGRSPFLVGGTGQYVRAVTHGWVPPQVAPDTAIRAELESLAMNKGPQCLYKELQKVDPAAAEKIDPRNIRRVIRALEVIQLTGKEFSAQRRLIGSPYHVFTVGDATGFAILEANPAGLELHE
jgi:tRNA dimethylallyltransferase